MKIEHDHHLISEHSEKLISAGFGEVFPHSIHFDGRNKALERVLAELCTRYDINQTTPEKSTLAYYSTDWDLFFWSNRGWNGSKEMNHFTLSFNENRNSDKNYALFLELLSFIESLEIQGLSCWVQYEAKLFENSLIAAAENYFQSVTGKFVQYGRMIGKIKIVGNNDDGSHEFGFFKKGARSRYYPIFHSELALMSLETA